MVYLPNENTVDWGYLEKPAVYTDDRLTLAKDVEKVEGWKPFKGLADINGLNSAAELQTMENLLEVGVDPYAPGRMGRVVSSSALRVDTVMRGVPIRVITSPHYTYFGFENRFGEWEYLRNHLLFRRRFKELHPNAPADNLEPPPHVKIRLAKEEEARKKHQEARAKADAATAQALARQKAEEERKELARQEKENREKAKALLEALKAKQAEEAREARKAETQKKKDENNAKYKAAAERMNKARAAKKKAKKEGL